MELPPLEKPLSTYEATERSDLPVGEYTMIVTKGFVADNKSKTGKVLTAYCQVVDGPLRGQMAFARFNIVHENPQAENIARGELKQLCEAVGINPDTLKDTDELHDRPFVGVIKNRKDGQGTEFGKFKPREGAPRGNPPANVNRDLEGKPAAKNETAKVSREQAADDDRPSWARD